MVCITRQYLHLAFQILSSILTVSIILGASFENPVWGLVPQRDIEEFLDLGEKGYYKHCLNKLSLLEDLEDLAKKVCKKNLEELTSTNASLQQNSMSNSTGDTTTYLTYPDYANGYGVEYPSDWHVSEFLGLHSIYKGTREFSIDIFDEPTYALINTEAFGDTYFDSYGEMDGVTITDSLARIQIGDEPALTFSYSKDDDEVMTAVLIHNNVGYAFKYTTLKQNFDGDYDTMTRFLASVKFLN